MKSSVLSLVLMALSYLAVSQDVVSGLVIEETEEGTFKPIPFVNVFWLGTQVGTASDSTGYFELFPTEESNQLVFSYVGFKSDTISVEQPDKLTVVLKNARELDAVDVVYREKSTSISYMNPIKTEQIGEEELYKAACCNLSESFETNPSVDVAYTDAVTGTKQIQMLGLDGKYTQITKEGIPEVRGLTTVSGLSFIPGTWVEGIQLNKGAGSVATGFESVTGQINVELEKPDETERWFLNGYVNQGGRSELNLHTAHTLNEKASTGLLLHGSVRPIEIDGNNDGFVDLPTGYTFTGINRWKFNNQKGLMGQIGIRALANAHRSGQYANDLINPYEIAWQTDRYEAWGKMGYVFPEAKYRSIGLRGKVVYHNTDQTFGLQTYNGTQRSAYVNAIYQSIIGTSTHKYRAGLSLQYDQFRERLNQDFYEREEIVPGAFVEYTLSYFDKFSMVAGLRGDYHNYYGFFVTPRLHVRYEIVEGSVLRISGGRGQRTANVIAENLSLLASSRTWMIMGDPSIQGFGLEPEIAWNAGLNFTQDFKLNYRPAVLSFDFYHTDFQNQTVIDMEDPREVRFYNLDGRSYATSFQAQLDYELWRRLDLRLAYRWYDVQTTYRGQLERRPYIAQSRAFVNVAYETKSKWKFDLTGQWQSPKRLPSTAANPVEYQRETVSPDLFFMNAQVTKSWAERFDVYLGVENITNVTQKDPIIADDDPFGAYFDGSMIWGPIFGRMAYLGFRLKSKR